MRDPNEPISVIEDLDPEPPPSRRARALEFIVGMALLLGVLGFVGWQWYHQNRQQSDYGSGIDAEKRHDWEAAQSYFAAASGYMDADRQAHAVATTIAQRDNYYNT